MPGRSDEDEAAEWASRLAERNGLEPHEQAALDRWLAGYPSRAGALLRAEATLAWVGRGRALAGDDLLPAAGRRFASRRTVGAGMGLAASVLLLLSVLPENEPLTTGLGEVRRVSLEDGSAATLNTRSKVAIAIDRDVRRATLIDGEAWFQVAHDRLRPFVVEAGDVRVRAVGTAFSVRRQADGVAILVTQGVVEIWADGAEGTPLRMAAGTRGLVRGRIIERPVRDPGAVERALAWRQGEIALDNETLAHAVSELNRYNVAKITVDPRLGELRLTGYFRTGDPAMFAERAARLAGGRVRRVQQDIEIVPAAPG